MSEPENIVIHSTLAVDPDYHEIILEFVDSIPAKIHSISDLKVRCAWDELRRVAHQLKGSGGGYGYPAISKLGGELEDAIKSERPASELNELADQLVSLLRRVQL